MHADPRAFDLQPPSVVDMSRIHPGVLDSIAFGVMRKLVYLRHRNPDPKPGGEDDRRIHDCLTVLDAIERFLPIHRFDEMYQKLSDMIHHRAQG